MKYTMPLLLLLAGCGGTIETDHAHAVRVCANATIYSSEHEYWVTMDKCEKEVTAREHGVQR